MAKLNKVDLLGIVMKEPLIELDSNGIPKRAQAFLSVANADRENGLSEKLFYTTPFIYSEDVEIASKMNTWHKNDIVLLSGVLTVLNAKRGSICPHCGHKMQRDGEVTFVTPVFVDTVFRDLEEKEAINLLNSRREISNRVCLLGYLCDDVSTKKEAGIYRDIISQLPYRGMSTFQIAVGRKLYMKSDVPTNRTDFPHIVSVGENAKNDAKCIHKGSEVLVEGMLVTREFRRLRNCEECGTDYEWPEKVLEVLTYGTEYLNDFITPEEADRLEQEEFERKKQAILEG